ncbi:hypothetical protein [Lentibacillus cibarius]|nr:hypothetical protein [Lentibacillus cibarius]
MCQSFLDVVVTPIYLALYFCTRFPATALSLGGLHVFVTFQNPEPDKNMQGIT